MKTYKTYLFRSKDPIIDSLRTIIQDQKVSYTYIENSSGVTAHTLRQWFGGKTKRPQHATVKAVAAALGYDYQLVKTAGAQIVQLNTIHRKASR